MRKKTTKEIILKRAASLFGEYSYDSLSMEKLAIRSHVAKSSIFYHFKNKKLLFQQVISSLFLGVFESLDVILKKNLNAEEKLELLVLAYCKKMQKRKALIKLWFSQNRFQKKMFSPVFLYYHKKIISRFAKVINVGIGEKMFSKEDPKKVARVFIAMIDGWLYQKFKDNNSVISEKALAKMLVKGLKI